MTWKKTGEVFAHDGPHIYDQIAWVGDVIGHAFDDPADYPGLSSHVVESANRPYRTSYNFRRATVKVFSEVDLDIWEKLDDANARMALEREKAKYPDKKSVRIRHGGIEMGFVRA